MAQGLGVGRQEDDCRALADKRGWTVAEVYVDNDISAWDPKKVRPAYRRMLADIADRQVDGLVVWALDRLHRQPRELEGFLDTCEKAGLTSLACVAGDVDLATSEGRMLARMLGAVDAKSSDDTSRRIKREQLQRAMAGKPVGARAYGYKRNRVEIDEDEAVEVKRMAEAFLAGEGLAAIARDLNNRGVQTATRRGLWSIVCVRGVLSSPAIAGLRQHQGKVIGEGEWPPIIDRATWDRLQAVLDDPARKKLHPGRKKLLSGMVVCGRCGHVMVYNKGAKAHPYPRFECHRVPERPDACSRVSGSGKAVEELVVEAVLLRLDTPDLARALQAVDQDDERGQLDREIADVDERRKELASMWAAGELSRTDWQAAREALDGRLEPLVKRRDRLSSSDALSRYGGKPGALRAAWPDLSVDRRRQILAAVIDRVIINPASRQGRTFNPDRLDIIWKV